MLCRPGGRSVPFVRMAADWEPGGPGKGHPRLGDIDDEEEVAEAPGYVAAAEKPDTARKQDGVIANQIERATYRLGDRIEVDGPAAEALDGNGGTSVFWARDERRRPAGGGVLDPGNVFDVTVAAGLAAGPRRPVRFLQQPEVAESVELHGRGPHDFLCRKDRLFALDA